MSGGRRRRSEENVKSEAGLYVEDRDEGGEGGK
jgi:hypothetical protein